jgi:hypothetical protein
MGEDFQEMFARLLALSKIQEAQIKATPIPYLNRLASEVCRLREAMNSAMYELSGATSFDHAQEAFPQMPPSIVETVTIRNQKAHDILAASLKQDGEVQP